MREQNIFKMAEQNILNEDSREVLGLVFASFLNWHNLKKLMYIIARLSNCNCLLKLGWLVLSSILRFWMWRCKVYVVIKSCKAVLFFWLNQCVVGTVYALLWFWRAVGEIRRPFLTPGSSSLRSKTSSSSLRIVIGWANSDLGPSRC